MVGWYYREIDVASAVKWLKQEIKKFESINIDKAVVLFVLFLRSIA